jgi:hypothetical protein
MEKKIIILASIVSTIYFYQNEGSELYKRVKQLFLQISISLDLVGKFIQKVFSRGLYVGDCKAYIANTFFYFLFLREK